LACVCLKEINWNLLNNYKVFEVRERWIGLQMFNATFNDIHLCHSVKTGVPISYIEIARWFNKIAKRFCMYDWIMQLILSEWIIPINRYVKTISSYKEMKARHHTMSKLWFIDWLIDWCLTSSEQFFSYIQDENI
jgi:hypothetical protein